MINESRINKRIRTACSAGTFPNTKECPNPMCGDSGVCSALDLTKCESFQAWLDRQEIDLNAK